MLAQQKVDEFRARLCGNLILPDDPSYNEARKVYNAMINKHPALIARCVDTADVISAVSDPTITYFETPIVVDNAAGRITDEGAVV